jgi:xanthine dehydrogenase large subunit
MNAVSKILSRLRKFASGIVDAPGGDLAEIRFEDGRVFIAGQAGRGISFPDLVRAACAARIDLGARGFYATPGIHFDWSKGTGNPFRYFTAGCAVTEVLIERLTGIVQVERADVLIEAAASINPGIDRGQIFGGFVQGLGWVLSEQLRYHRGHLETGSLSTYKIPTIHDVPASFRVELMNHPDPDLLIGGKGLGEPPFILGLSVWTAIKHALSSIRPGIIPRLDLPATPERILLEIDRLQSREAAAEDDAPILAENRISAD